MSEDELEPVEADPVPAAASAEPDGESVVTTEAAALSDREGQRLVSTQTVQHDYLTLNGKVAGDTITVDGTVTTVMDFIYDESGRPFALKYSDDGGKSFDTYYYVLNLQGDVVKLVWYIPGFEYKAVATYTYDAWGNVLTATGELAEINPLRYRGYYYDSETGFYYIKSRYYDPVQHRYLNADTVFDYDVGFPGYNLFAYCGNSPVFRIDVNGRDSEPADDHEQILTNSTLGGGGGGGFTGGGGGGCSGVAPVLDEQDEDRRRADDYIQAKNAQSNTMRRGGETEATKRGREMHKNWDYGDNVIKEKRIGEGARVDGFDVNNNLIFELKPNNPGAISKGLRQLDRYLNMLGADEWAGILVLYD